MEEQEVSEGEARVSAYSLVFNQNEYLDNNGINISICINTNVIIITEVDYTDSFIIEVLLWTRHHATLFTECSFQTSSNSVDYFILRTSIIQVGALFIPILQVSF